MLGVILLGIAVLGFLYVYHVNHSMSGIPEEARKWSPHRLNVDEIMAAYKRAVDSPVDVTRSLPPKQGRRYIVVGGAGTLRTFHEATACMSCAVAWLDYDC